MQLIEDIVNIVHVFFGYLFVLIGKVQMLSLYMVAYLVFLA